MKICVIGSNGHMGSIVRRIGTEKGYEMVGIDQSNSELNFDSSFDGDAIIDFSTAKIMNKTIDFALRNKVPYVVAVTGYEEDIKQRLEAASKEIPVFVSANFSLGVHRLKKLIKYAQELSDKVDIEIIDVHHNRKIDAPSGTAKELANVLGGDIHTSSLRIGTVVGDHTVVFGYDQERIEITHRAQSREIFAHGALNAAVYLAKQKPGFYGMDDLFKGDQL